MPGQSKLIRVTFRPARQRPVPAKPPGILRRLANFAKAAARHIAAGMPKASEEEQSRRMALCQVCPEFDAAAAKCRQCGCRLNAKIPWALEKCPIGKW